MDTNSLLRNSIENRTLSPNSIQSSSPSSTRFSSSNRSALEANLAYNKYTRVDEHCSAYQMEPIHRYNGTEGSYMDYLNNVRGENDLLDVAGTLFNGQGIGIGTNGVETNFDIRNTIAGRVLTSTGVLNDTPLGKIGNQELLKMIGNNTLFNLQAETIGRVNLDPINAVKGGSIIRPNYSITIGYDGLGKVAKTIEDITGLTLPIEKLSDESSIWTRGNSQNLIKNTGKGQVQALFTNLSENKYGPGYEDSRIKNVSVKDQATYQETIQDQKGLTRGVDNYDGFDSNEDSMLGRTKALIEDGEIFTGDQKMVEKGFTTNTTTVGGMEFISKGSGVKSASALDGGIENVFGRVFTKDKKYNKVRNLQKHRGLDNKNYAQDSVLDSNGFVRVTPYHNDGTGTRGEFKNMKRFMLSLENLAWDGETQKLPSSEIGPGDPVNGSRGRIMWFPPYELSFTDTTSVNWQSTNFIGRGEPVYTYNNTERRGVLQFKMIIDYPSYIEDIKNSASDDLLSSIAAGEKEYQLKNLSSEEISELDLFLRMQTYEFADAGEVEPEDFTVYFDKDSTTLTNDAMTAIENKVDELLTQCPSCKVSVRGFTSTDEDRAYSKNRASVVKDYFQGELDGENTVVYSTSLMGHIGCSGENIALDAQCRKDARRVDITFEYVPTQNEQNQKNEESVGNTAFVGPASNKTLSGDIKKRFLNESMYFQKLSEDDPIAYEAISDKIKYFHPAFHSMTPEGFNSRLSFLQQCTRQGPTQNSDRADNLAFGKPPVCILRVGDFYNTKIVMDTLNFSFEPLLWDLNPEGVGVQPMICTVDIGFAFIGGSSLRGPINKLQNAVSHNFFANTEVFDPRAESIVNGKYESSDYELNDSKNEDPGKQVVDEKKRAEVESVEEPDDEKRMMENLQLTIVGSGLDNITFQVTKKAGYTETIKPTKFKTYIHIVDVIPEENNKGLVSLTKQQRPNVELTEELIGVDINISVSEIQETHMDTIGNQIILTLEHDGMKLTNTYTIN